MCESPEVILNHRCQVCSSARTKKSRLLTCMCNSREELRYELPPLPSCSPTYLPKTHLASPFLPLTLFNVFSPLNSTNHIPMHFSITSILLCYIYYMSLFLLFAILLFYLCLFQKPIGLIALANTLSVSSV